MQSEYYAKALERFFVKVNKTDSCWIWTGKAGSSNGDARFYFEGKFISAHHFIYRSAHGELPNSGFIHRSCNNHLCVNPEHLYVSSDPRGRSPEERFWEKVDKSGDCWIWKGKKRKKRGYGLFFFDGRWVQPHRFVYELINGNIPENNVICHRCDNPSCVNPSHLFTGTQKDNVQDMMQKGRSNHSKGEKVNTAKLTEDIVRQIRTEYRPRTASALARKYGVSCVNILAIVNRETWKHVD